jgi:hypothetical protein
MRGEYRYWVAAALLGLALAINVSSFGGQRPQVEPGSIDLTAAFIGPTAAADASLLAAMADEVAGVIEFDGKQDKPLLTTGHQLDQLRTRTREWLMRGESLGERQPKVRQIVGEYLESKLGHSGGEITAAQRDSWVAAYRDIARSARHALSR